ncbi:MAG: hypothetical protein ABIH66_03140 [bacterium]
MIMKREKKKSSGRINDLVSETVDKISKVLDNFYEKAGDIAKDSGDSERVEEMVDKIKKIRKNIAEGTGDAIKNISKTVTEAGESIFELLKKKKDD